MHTTTQTIAKRLLAKFLVSAFLVLFISCNQDVYLVDPVITIDPFEAAPLDTVTTTLIGELEIDGNQVQIDSFEWHVFDAQNNTVLPQSTNDEIMTWIPMDEGVYNIEVTVSSGNKSVKEIKQVNIKHNTTSIQRYLAGNWEGDGVATFAGGIQWKAEFNISPNGQYSGVVTSVQSGNISSVFNNGVDSISHPEKKFTVTDIDGNGNASGEVTFVHWDGELLEYGFKELKFSNNYNTVDFTVFWGAELTYHLERQ